MKPTSAIATDCARAAIGKATAALTAPTKSRLLMSMLEPTALTWLQAGARFSLSHRRLSGTADDGAWYAGNGQNARRPAARREISPSAPLAGSRGWPLASPALADRSALGQTLPSRVPRSASA